MKNHTNKCKIAQLEKRGYQAYEYLGGIDRAGFKVMTGGVHTMKGSRRNVVSLPAHRTPKAA